MLKDCFTRLVLVWVLSFLGLGVGGCASHVTIHKGTLGTPKHSLFKVWGTWNLTAECTPFEKLLDGMDAIWKAKLPTPVADAAAIATKADARAIAMFKAFREIDEKTKPGGGG